MDEEKPEICEACSQAFSSKESLEEHLLTHKEKKSFFCDTCLRNFSDEAKYKKHILVHARASCFSCSICPKEFPSKMALDAHVLSHESKKPFACDECEESFSRKSLLEKHKLQHAEKQPDSKNEDEQQLNMLVESEEKQTFNCTKCSDVFDSKGELKIHKLQVHSLKYKCSSCPKGFPSKKQLNVHRTECKIISEKFKIKAVRRLSSKKLDVPQESDDKELEYPFECKKCNVKFVKKQGLMKHLAKRECSNITFFCGRCGTSFSSIKAKEEHPCVAQTPKYQCGICDNIFPSKTGLSMHISKVHDAKKKSYSCKVCKREFMLQYDLELHEKSSLCVPPTPEEPAEPAKVTYFKCPQCTSVFNSEKSLNLHKNRVHTRERTVICKGCKQTFFAQHDLEIHQMASVCSYIVNE